MGTRQPPARLRPARAQLGRRTRRQHHLQRRPVRRRRPRLGDAALANPELDLGWWLFITRYCTEGVGAPVPPGFLDRGATIERYHELTGHNVEHIDYYETFAAIRLAILYHRAGVLMLKAGLCRPTPR